MSVTGKVVVFTFLNILAIRVSSYTHSDVRIFLDIDAIRRRIELAFPSILSLENKIHCSLSEKQGHFQPKPRGLKIHDFEYHKLYIYSKCLSISTK